MFHYTRNRRPYRGVPWRIMESAVVTDEAMDEGICGGGLLEGLGDLMNNPDKTDRFMSSLC